MRSTPSHGLASLLLGSSTWCALFVARVYYCGHFTYGFLVWNLFLAWVPWLLALGVDHTLRRRWDGAALPLGIAWVLFLPNAPYVLTDFVHLRARSPVPLWFDVLLLGTAALTGLLAGAFSLRRVEDALQGRVEPRLLRVGLWATIVAAGFGIYLGRFERLNSWDLLLTPSDVLLCAAHVLEPRALVVTLACASLLGITYVGIADRRAPR